MALTGLDYIFGSGLDLIPHIEHMALKYVFAKYAMAPRVKVLTDMQGWNVRKWSEYLPSRRAVALSEDTAIPDTTVQRTRKGELSPKEIGDRYRISDRRRSTDLEDIIADTVEFLGAGIGARVESDLFQTALSTFFGGTLGSAATDYSLALPLQGATVFNNRRRTGTLYHVIHPYQALPVMEKLIQFTGTDSGTNLDFRNQAISSFTLPTFGGMNLAIADLMPRKVVFKAYVDGTGGTFRLQISDGNTVGEHITATITVSATPATMITNIKAALEALTFTGNGTWTVTGSANNDITITPPATLYLDDDSQLRVAVKYDEDGTLDNYVALQKSAYDLVTGLGGNIVDSDGNSLGIKLYERSASAKSLMFYPDALAFDIREAVKSHFETVFQGRTAEYSAYMKYGVGKWSPELGMFIETTANSPFAVGA
ncbi:hypothetical protein LCGC14_1174280 [marine sediment metagenome]|uniref:Capsid protein n=1 Tax=marine sediment metagenome TaxID=412755 RepID=A0A0F9PUG8_9ZZZZ